MRCLHLLRLTGLFLALLLPATVGCAKKGSTVAGRVTYDNQDVAVGYISFAPEDGQGETKGGPIRNGQYKILDVPPGKFRFLTLKEIERLKSATKRSA